MSFESSERLNLLLASIREARLLELIDDAWRSRCS